MKIDIVACTGKGALLAEKILTVLNKEHECRAYALPRHLPKSSPSCLLRPLEESLGEWTAKRFGEKDGLIFICACGIAVRMIAPFVRDKLSDPAVIAIDEEGKFVIPLLSGHVGGANRLARQMASITGGTAVISTATDLNGFLGIDEWAARHDCIIGEKDMIKKVSSALLDGQKVGIFTSFPIIGEVPQGFEPADHGEVGVNITLHPGAGMFAHTLNLYPRVLALGLGCRRDTPPEAVERAVDKVLKEHNLARECISVIGTIDLKKDEKGINQLAVKYGVDVLTYSADQLNQAKGDFSASAFVRSVTGADNVCERAAVLASQEGRLIIGKNAADGVTVALACRDWEINFDNKDERG